MGFLSKLFGKKPHTEKLPQNVRDAFERLTSILNDDEKQNSLMPNGFQKNLMPLDTVDKSIANDTNFGRSISAAIPVNGPIGEITYLSKLETVKGSKLFFHRLGSIKHEQRNIDIYEIASWDGLVFDVLYFDYYYDEKINAAPKGYIFSEKVDGLTGVNQFVKNFPVNIYEETQGLAQKILGVPLANPFMRHIDARKIKIPPEFAEKIDLLLDGIAKQQTVTSIQKRDESVQKKLTSTSGDTIQLDKPSEEFALCWSMAGKHLENCAQGRIFWLKAHLQPPFLEHLSFRLGNQLFFVRVEDVDHNLETPGSYAGLMRISKNCGGHPCTMPMKKQGNTWKPAEGGWGLLHAQTRHGVDPVSLISQEDIEMTEWELFDFAVQIVRNNLGGRQIMSWNSDPEVTPSIWFVGEHGPEWILVKAVKYPETDAELPDNIDEVSSRCSKIAHKGNFAVVGIASAEERSNVGEPLPLLRGHGLVARYDGLRDIVSKNTHKINGSTNSQMVSLEETVKDLLEQDIEQIKKGELPERRLIPHHAIKRDILLLGFEKDFSSLSNSMKELNKDDFGKHMYAIKRLSVEQLDEQLKLRMASIGDIEELENNIRKNKAMYSIVPRICRNGELHLDTLNSAK
ncbi:MAG: hypothetical protein DELT_01157 [Desulfovibrio sp.]